MKSYPEKSFSLNYRHPFDSVEEIFYLRLYFSWYLLARTANVIIKPKRFCIMYKRVTVLGRILSLIVSAFLIFMFVDQLLLVDVFSEL